MSEPKPLSSYTLTTAVIVLIVCCGPARSSQDEVSSTLNQQVSVSNKEETLNIGNEETNNYNIQAANYKPSQSTQVVFNVGKLNKNKLRVSRPPTQLESAIKSRILHVYQGALGEVQAINRRRGRPMLHLKHLGRILEALNPKYIATERVMRVAFSDVDAPPPIELIPPEAESVSSSEKHLEPPAIQPLELSGANERPVLEQLDLLSERFLNLVSWDRQFAQSLFRVSESQISPKQLAFKRLLQCLAYPLFCNKPVGKTKAPDERLQQETKMVASSSGSGSGSSPPQQQSFKSAPFEPQQFGHQFGRQFGPAQKLPNAHFVSRQQQQQQQQQPEYQPEAQYVRPQPAPRRRILLPQQVAHSRENEPLVQYGQQQMRANYPLRSPPVSPQGTRPPPSHAKSWAEQPQLPAPESSRGLTSGQDNSALTQRLIEKFAPDYSDHMRG